MNRISKTAFFEMFPDPSVFDGGKYNLMRVIQSALLTRPVERIGKITRRSLFLQPYLIVKNYLLIRSFKQKKPDIHFKPTQKYLFICPIRFSKDPETGIEKNNYIEKIVELLGREYCHIHYRNKLPQATIIDSDSSLSEWLNTRIPFGSFDKTCIQLIRNTFDKLRRNPAFSAEDIVELRQVLDDFWRESRLYYFYLKQSNVSTAFIYPAYQNEALVYALREAGIKVVELQHGVISKGANFYVYPPAVQKVNNDLLLPDEIWVWGTYWKSILLEGYEFLENQIKVAGDFIKRPDSVKFSTAKEKILLVALSTGTQSFFIPYIKRLYKYILQHPGWRLWIKLHPGDPNNQVYYDAFENYDQLLMVDKKTNIFECLQRASIQVSIFSNTLFEAVGTYTISFCLDADERYKGFVEDVITSRVAYKLDTMQDPILRMEELLPAHKEPEREHFFSTFSIPQV